MSPSDRSSTPLERRTVSRKTPGDGRLEITRETARRIEPLGARVPMAMDGAEFEATVGTLPCTCRGEDKPHVHYFLQAERFRGLSPGTTVSLGLDDTGRLVVGES
jgi:hypothetical protein